MRTHTHFCSVTSASFLGLPSQRTGPKGVPPKVGKPASKNYIVYSHQVKTLIYLLVELLYFTSSPLLVGFSSKTIFIDMNIICTFNLLLLCYLAQFRAKQKPRKRLTHIHMGWVQSVDWTTGLLDSPKSCPNSFPD